MRSISNCVYQQRVADQLRTAGGYSRVATWGRRNSVGPTFSRMALLLGLFSCAPSRRLGHQDVFEPPQGQSVLPDPRVSASKKFLPNIHPRRGVQRIADGRTLPLPTARGVQRTGGRPPGSRTPNATRTRRPVRRHGQSRAGQLPEQVRTAPAIRWSSTPTDTRVRTAPTGRHRRFSGVSTAKNSLACCPLRFTGWRYAARAPVAGPGGASTLDPASGPGSRRWGADGRARHSMPVNRPRRTCA
jgi:hypothetical protein